MDTQTCDKCEIEALKAVPVDGVHLALPMNTCRSACTASNRAVHQTSGQVVLGLALHCVQHRQAHPNANAGKMSAPCCMAIRTKPATMTAYLSVSPQISAMEQEHGLTTCGPHLCAAGDTRLPRCVSCANTPASECTRMSRRHSGAGLDELCMFSHSSCGGAWLIAYLHTARAQRYTAA